MSKQSRANMNNHANQNNRNNTAYWSSRGMAKPATPGGLPPAPPAQPPPTTTATQQQQGQVKK